MITKEAIDRIGNLMSWVGHDVFITKKFVEELRDIINLLKEAEIMRKYFHKDEVLNDK